MKLDMTLEEFQAITEKKDFKPEPIEDKDVDTIKEQVFGIKPIAVESGVTP